jgi:hypothetical protein
MSEAHPSDFAAQLELAWAAGFFDGEGCTFLANIAKGRFSYAGITIKQVVAENLERFKAAVGGLGNINGPYQEVARCSPVSKYRVVGTGARQVLRLLWPYLGGAKRQQAERVLAAENNKGGVAFAKRTHCPKGHPYDEANTRATPGGRCCRACDAEAHRRKRKAVGPKALEGDS